MGKDFDMDIVEVGETLRVILNRQKDPKADVKSKSSPNMPAPAEYF